MIHPPMRKTVIAVVGAGQATLAKSGGAAVVPCASPEEAVARALAVS